MLPVHALGQSTIPHSKDTLEGKCLAASVYHVAAHARAQAGVGAIHTHPGGTTRLAYACAGGHALSGMPRAHAHAAGAERGEPTLWWLTLPHRPPRPRLRATQPSAKRRSGWPQRRGRQNDGREGGEKEGLEGSAKAAWTARSIVDAMHLRTGAGRRGRERRGTQGEAAGERSQAGR